MWIVNKHSIIFELDECERISIEIDQPLEDLECYCQTPIVFYKNTWTYPLSVEDIKENMDIFCDQLQQALNNELQLYPSINLPLGYMHNFYLKHCLEGYVDSDVNLVWTAGDVSESWIGTNFQLFGHKGLATWLYNDKEGSIVFEITPVYLEEYETISEHDKASFFDQWIKKYKSYIHRKIPKHIAYSWLRQSNLIRSYIDEKFYECECYRTGGKGIYQQCARAYGQDTRLSERFRIVWLQAKNMFLRFFE